MNTGIALGASSVLQEPDYQWADFPIPGHTGQLEATFLNRDIRQGPIVAIMKMYPGSRIPQHKHERTTETFFVMEGEFINAGITYGPGAFFSNKQGEVHGPHESPKGAKLMFMQAVEVDPTDFIITE